MKHPHSELIKQWLEDTKQEIEMSYNSVIAHTYYNANIVDVLLDINGTLEFKLKPKPDEYEHLRQAISDGKKIEVYSWDKRWVIREKPLFTDPLEYYRIHDPYRELKEAKDRGERIVFQLSNGEWIDINEEGFEEERYPSKRYKVAEQDQTTTISLGVSLFGNGLMNIKLTKSGIDGTIKVEVVE